MRRHVVPILCVLILSLVGVTALVIDFSGNSNPALGDVEEEREPIIALFDAEENFKIVKKAGMTCILFMNIHDNQVEAVTCDWSQYNSVEYPIESGE